MPANERLRRLRTERNWSQQDVADQVGVALITMHRWERGSQQPSAYYRVKLCALFGVSTQELGFLESLSPPTPEEAKASTPAPPDATLFEELALWTVPYARNPHFTGRDELLSHLERRFARGAAEQPTTVHRAALTQSQAIKGLGGIGKTQTAIEYAYRSREQGRYTHTLWISAASEEAVLASFAALTERVPALLSKEGVDQRALASRALRWLEQCPESWLLIYDNADETAFLPPYLPTAGRGSLLFTTRSSAVGTLAPSLEVDALPMEEGVQLLLRRAGREGEVSREEREEVSAIVLALGRFPLAIDQAGAYLEETGCSLADYLQIYRKHQYELLARRGKQAHGYPDSVATTWSLAFEQIERSDPAAAELLRLCAFVAPDHIPEELLTEGAAFWPAALQEAVTDRLRFNQMLSTLLAFSLIKRFGQERMLSLHRLVQVVQRESITPEEQRQWTKRLVLAVQAIFPREQDVASWQACQRYLEQALACETLIQEHHLSLSEAADMLDWTGCYLVQRALFSLGEPLLRRALDMREQLMGPEHLDVSVSLTNLASLSWRLGAYSQAVPLYQRVLCIREQQLGPEHLDVAEALNDLALVYYSQGNYSQAEPLYQRSLRICEQQFGSEHHEITTPLHNLALLYSKQGKYAQAELLCQRALRLREQQLGPEHPLVGTSINNLAGIYVGLRKYTQAEPLYQRTLRIFEQQLGPEHPNVASPLLGLAGLSYEQGRYADAEEFARRALRLREQQLGPKNPSVADPLRWLALVAAQYGKDEEAERFHRQALHLWEEQLGPEHPNVAYALHGLALLYARQGRESQAEALFQRALYIREQRLGETHLETAEVLYDFAGFQQSQGQSQEAMALYQRALVIREHAFGEDSPMTIDTRVRLQEVLVALGRTQESAQERG